VISSCIDDVGEITADSLTVADHARRQRGPDVLEDAFQ